MAFKKKNRLLIGLGIFIVILGIIAWGLMPNSFLGRLTSGFSAVHQPLKEGADQVSDTGEGLFQSIFYGMRIREENQELRAENAALHQQIRTLEAENLKYQELKQAVNIKEHYEGYELLHASVMSRSFGNIFDMFSIDRGIVDGLSDDPDISYAVIDANMNLVGRLAHINKTGAKVLPLYSEGFTVIGKVNQPDGAVFRVHGDLSLSQDNLCIIDGVHAEAELNPGDEIVTEGSGGLFPAGIAIGTVLSVEEQGGQRVATLEPNVLISDITDVFILVGKPTENIFPEDSQADRPADEEIEEIPDEESQGKDPTDEVEDNATGDGAESDVESDETEENVDEEPVDEDSEVAE
ncbi:MAG TPA: rod shape-determining protein MreC [Clostridiaceae bacterium]|nr:rod shape-determining protein MreC [Clostridiaceae bacterium]